MLSWRTAFYYLSWYEIFGHKDHSIIMTQRETNRDSGSLQNNLTWSWHCRPSTPWLSASSTPGQWGVRRGCRRREHPCRFPGHTEFMWRIQTLRTSKSKTILPKGNISQNSQKIYNICRKSNNDEKKAKAGRIFFFYNGSFNRTERR